VIPYSFDHDLKREKKRKRKRKRKEKEKEKKKKKKKKKKKFPVSFFVISLAWAVFSISMAFPVVLS
jgi:NADH:ubiquinone oxidoreductase subunit 3 (subunit A)